MQDLAYILQALKINTIMETNDNIDDGGTKQDSSGLAGSRSRRERNPRAAKAGRFAALAELKV